MNQQDKDHTLTDKRKQFQGYLAKQQKQRQEALALKKKKQQNTKNNAQKMLVIQKQFRQKQQELDLLVKKYRAQEVKYEDVLTKYTHLKNYYLEINYALFAYDRQGYKQTLEKILNQIQDLKKKLEPRKKFKFSRRDQDFGVKIVKEEKALEYKQGYQASVPGLSKIQGQNVIISHDKLGGPYKIIQSADSSFYLQGVTQILFLKNLKNCKVYAGPTKSTVFIDNCTNCQIQISCHQLRIHNTYDTKFGVFTSSKGIIEYTKNVIFKPYSYSYDGIEKDVQECEREGKNNLWRDIQDFNWLKQQASPNFTLQETQTLKQ